jgi:hypothetical protein
MADATDKTQQPFALVGYVDTPAELYHACEEIRDAGYKSWDAHTPFPVHGLDKAMGLPPSRLGWVVLCAGLCGLAGVFGLAYYTQQVAYAHVIGGKEAFSYQAFIPIFFEGTVLFSAFGAFFGVWVLNKAPEFFHPVMQHPSFDRATDDKFFVSIEARDGKFDRQATKEFLVKLGFKEVEEVMP